MRAFETWGSNVSRHWFMLLYPTGDMAHDRLRDVSILQLVRLMALALSASAWIALTLATGIFSVAPEILIGFVVGSSHRILPFRFHRAHLPSTVYIALFGGLLANVLAGLAEFSATMGVSYGAVLAARRIPEDIPMLGNAFVEAFRVQDSLYYAIGLVTAVWCALHHRKN